MVLFTGTTAIKQEMAPAAAPETLRSPRFGTISTAGLYATPAQQMATLQRMGIAGRANLLDPGTVAGGTAEAMRRLQQAPIGSREAQQALSTIQWGASAGRRLLEQGQPTTTPPSEWASLMETAPAAAQLAAQYQNVLQRAQALTAAQVPEGATYPVEYVTTPGLWSRIKPYLPLALAAGGLGVAFGVFYYTYYGTKGEQ